MKKILYLTLVLPLFLFSCESSPRAFFSVDSSDPEVGREVFFNNDSHNAERFEWDFGDGYISHEVNPGHIYTANGVYEVSLIAISKSGMEDKAILTLDVKIPTLLEIEVREYFDGYTVSDASVILFPSLADWDAQTNSVSEGFTDGDGVVVFSGLDPKAYYADVLEQNHDNYALRAEDPGFVRTPVIIPHKINRFIAFVDYVPNAKGSAKGTRSAIIKKFERRATDKVQPAADSGTQGWQELYNKRAIQK
jgi:PKD repeat protein